MLVVCATALKKIRVVALSVKVFNAIFTNSRAWQHSKPSKGIFSAYISFLISHVPPRPAIWFRENVLDGTKAGIAQSPDGWSYEHLPVSILPISGFFVHYVGGKKRSGEVAPRSWRDAATTRFGSH